MADQQVHMRVWRGDASGGEFKDYRIAVGEGQVVLDVIHAIQAQQANDLAVRWNCKAGKCGSCSAEVNGKPRLMCMTRMNTFRARRNHHAFRRCEPFPIIRDLVTDVSFNFKKPRDSRRSNRNRKNPTARGGCIKKTSIGCKNFTNASSVSSARMSVTLSAIMMKTSRPSPGRASLSAWRLWKCIPLDTNDRMELIKQKAGFGYCNITKCCTEVCPEHIHITDNAIIPLKERVVDRYYDPIAKLIGLFSRKNK